MSYQNRVIGLFLISIVQGHVGIPLRIMAGITTGGMAVLCAQPTDVVKVRFQCQAAGVPKRYNGVFAAYRAIAVEEGVRGLWKGVCCMLHWDLFYYDEFQSWRLYYSD